MRQAQSARVKTVGQRGLPRTAQMKQDSNATVRKLTQGGTPRDQV